MAVGDVNIKALDSKWAKNLYVPAYNTAAFTQAFAQEATAAAGSNAVRIIEAGKEGVPLAHAAQGKTYTVQLSNFPRATDLTVYLIGERDGLQTVTPVGSVTTGRDGAAALSWPVAADAGAYYLKAVDATLSVFGMSMTIDVVPKARRKLYGPLLEL
jgi:hypothetical protein